MSSIRRPDAGAPRWVANLSLLFTELPLLERPAAAAAEGFDAIEYWWPFGVSGRPSADEVNAFISAIEDARVSLVAMNLFAGDMPAGERGVLSYPERTDEFRDSVAVAVEIGRRLGTRMFNAPYGHVRAGLDPEEQTRVGDANLAFAAKALGAIAGVILLEPVSRMPRYVMKTAAHAFAIRDRLHARGFTNVAFLLDQYHLAMNGEDVLGIIAAHVDEIAHVQLADVPNRGEPGSGDGDVRPAVEALLAAGYDRLMALEYIPTTNTPDSLASWRRDAANWSTPTGP